MTIKEYYKDYFLAECIGEVCEILEDGIYFDRTVAFPEGGGQIGDSGKLINLETGAEMEFFYTTKSGGRQLNLENFPNIFVEGDILHHLAKEDLEKVKIGDKYRIIIDIEKRAMATINHSGIHVVLMELEKLRPDISSKIYGAKISEKSARLDFMTEEKFSKEELSIIEKNVNTLIEAEKNMRVYPHPTEKEALFWECDGYSIPCGGTHLTNTKYLGEVKLKRKNIGKNCDRIIAQFENCKIPEYKNNSDL